MRYELSPKNTAIIRGPASVVLVSGQATILGGPFVFHKRKVVASQKQLPIETKSRAEFEINLGKLGEIFEAKGSTIPPSWRVAAQTLAEMREGRVIILGPPDVGKSTLCTYLVNKLLHNEQSLCVIDADIGQTDMGPPTTIARSFPTQPIASLQELTPDRQLFIGHISPSGVEQKLISHIQTLLADSKRSLTIINTDGWVADSGATLYKINLLTRIQPDLVLGLAYSNELEPILRAVRFHTIKINAAKDTLERSRADRKSLRRDGYRRALEGAVTRRISLQKVQLYFPSGFRGVSSEESTWENLIVGMLDDEGYLVEIGILMGLEHEAAVIYSRKTERIHRIEVGHVKLSRDGHEIGFL